MRLLDVRDRAVTKALEAADEGMMRCLARAADHPRGGNPGLFCCGKCSVGLWRNILSGGLDRREERLERGVAYLRLMRVGDRGWRRFPFWYTGLALGDMDVPGARRELKYAAPAFELTARRAAPSSPYVRRRQALAIRILNRL